MNDVARTEYKLHLLAYWQVEFPFHDAVIHARFPCTQVAVEVEFANLLDALAVTLQSIKLVLLGFVRRVC